MTKIDISEFSQLLSDLQKLKLTVGWSLTGTKATFQEFKNDTSLKGSAWDTTKQFFFEGYIPIIDGMNDPFYLLVETTEQFIHDFENEVTTESVKLDLEQLADLQARRDELQQKKEDWFHKLADVASKIPWAGQLFDDYSLFQANKKVALLEDFESFINRHGSDFSVLNNQIEQALLGLDELGKQKSFNGDQKRYQAVDFSKSNWYKKVTDYHKEHGTHIEEVQKRDIENFKEMAKVAGSAVAMDSFAMNNEIAGMAGPLYNATENYFSGINVPTNKGIKEQVINSNARVDDDFATDIFLPKSYYENNYAPIDGTPNSKIIFKRLGSSGNIEESLVFYNQYGKQSVRVDLSNHGNSLHHTEPHVHEFFYINGGKIYCQKQNIF
ncbi:T7SS effector LXG polymorphic toxin [Carnobacterium divergens]|uniref:LXG domain-containing protein n=1 Tax=Carnobacterium divergens DSM 20623 TaxID=1449336 RepID=A0A0R2I6X3_CARDV|nr:T7SS effector LXG polymorphic toxin [Carnobacterium divergens]KRN57751.1 hypothetical protein IV74_GL001006 [Carnobacterium divergens DSM 20623]MDO0874379.1 LXG domain-containing protein [Carnobacterium divergens]SUX21718.1 Bacillus transposase protein [Carnobacterium divergens]